MELIPKNVSWVEAYLSNRSQFVSVNNAESDYLDVISGVPQGSVLGPTLFLVYIDDVYTCMEPGVTIRLFADDCVIYTPVKTVDEQTKLNKSLQNIVTWCKKWGMQINTQKTMCMTVTRKKEPLNFTYKLINTSLERVDSVKYLGVTITRSLKWDVHINNVCARAFKQLGFLRRKLATAPTSVKLTAYKTLVRTDIRIRQHSMEPASKIFKLSIRKDSKQGAPLHIRKVFKV